MLIPRYSHGLTPNTAKAVCMMYSLKRVCGAMNIQQSNCFADSDFEIMHYPSAMLTTALKGKVYKGDSGKNPSRPISFG